MRTIILVTVIWLLTAGGLALGAGTKTQASLRFSHKSHEKNSVSCMTCHVDREAGKESMPALPVGWQPLRQTPVVASSAGHITHQNDINDSFGRPGEKRCLACHFKTREKSDCGLCHMEKPAPTDRERQRLGKGFVFSHQKHEKVDCSRCHPGITGWENLDGHMIRAEMSNCLECHNGKDAPKNCVMCHAPTPRPADHTRNYEKKHGVAYRSEPHRCQMCHEDSSCLDCHSRKPRDHTLAWVRHRHGLASRTNPQKCQACHSDPYVCKRCHENW